jgi:hypothetical protein
MKLQRVRVQRRMLWVSPSGRPNGRSGGSGRKVGAEGRSVLSTPSIYSECKTNAAATAPMADSSFPMEKTFNLIELAQEAQFSLPRTVRPLLLLFRSMTKEAG